MSIFSGCIEKSRILWYNILSVGVGPAKATVWKGFHAVFVLFYNLRGYNMEKIMMLEYHQVLFRYFELLDKDIIQKRDHCASVFLKEYIKTIKNTTSMTFSQQESFLINLQGKIEGAMKSIIEKKSVYYWMHLYRRIGVSPSFNGESEVTLYLYRNILEMAFQKYGNSRIGDELILAIADNDKEKIANGLLKKASEHFHVWSVVKEGCEGFALGNFTTKDYSDIYILEAFAFEYWKTTSCLRRLYKGGSLVVTNDNYYVDCDKSIEFLMQSFDHRTQNMSLWTSRDGIVFGGTKHSSANCSLPLLNVYRESIIDTMQLDLFGHSMFTQDFIPNYLSKTIDFGEYYSNRIFYKERFEKKFGYTLDSFCCTVYLMSMIFYSLGCHSFIRFIEIVKRGYLYFDGISDFCDTLFQAYQKIESTLPFKTNKTEIEKVLQDMTLSEDRQCMSLATLGPKYAIIPIGDRIVIDFVAIPSILETKINRMGNGEDGKGHLFEKIANETLEELGFQLWEHKELHHEDGTKKEIDLSFIYNDCLYVGELKTPTMALNYTIGSVESLNKRKEWLLKYLDLANDKAMWLKNHVSGTNYSIPNYINRIVPFVMTPFVEYIWSKDSFLWLTESIPRICALKECQLLSAETVYNEVISKPYVIDIQW